MTLAADVPRPIVATWDFWSLPAANQSELSISDSEIDEIDTWLSDFCYGKFAMEWHGATAVFRFEDRESALLFHLAWA